jgi:hypothetical protein
LKRLIRKSKWFNSVEVVPYYMSGNKKIQVDIYKNPSSTEILECRNKGNGYLRGIIDNNNDEYCWRGDILHDDMNEQVDVSQFRFSTGSDGSWLMDCNDNYSLIELCKFIIDNKLNFNKYGTINDNTSFEILNTTDRYDEILSYNDLQSCLEDGIESVLENQ